ncbi:MAG: alpha/beta hydrolase [Lachnospiraceae bacterium]|nr:alpha/beta hydrolase [Lachnospiraceae bacterium]
MNAKYFSINEDKLSIRCKLYENKGEALRRLILFGHGFGGHKDNRACEHFAERVLQKNRGAAVLVFDWPCHGEDARKVLRLEDCDLYLGHVLNYIQTTLRPERLDGYGTSFGGFLFLKYISEHGNPFEKLALRCPAVTMAESLTETILTAEETEKLLKGKKVQAGFDRKVEIDLAYLESLREHDVRKMEFIDDAENILIVQGTKDEIIPPAAVRAFADDNLIEYVSVENADHRFMDPKKMDEAVSHIIKFLDLR